MDYLRATSDALDGREVGCGAYSEDKAAVSAQPQQVVDRYRAAPLRLYHRCPNVPVETPTTIGTLGVDECVEMRIDDLIAEPGARDTRRERREVEWRMHFASGRGIER